MDYKEARKFIAEWGDFKEDLSDFQCFSITDVITIVQEAYEAGRDFVPSDEEIEQDLVDSFNKYMKMHEEKMKQRKKATIKEKLGI